MTQITAQITMRKDTSANWTANNPTLAIAEWGIETDTGLLKLGTGALWNATTYFTSGGGVWGSITGTLSNQTDLNTALGLKAPLASPGLTGTPTTPTAALGTSTAQIASTAFVAAKHSYALKLASDANTAPGDNQTVYFGALPGTGITTTGGIRRIPIPKTGTITNVSISCRLPGTFATGGELTQVNIRLNNTTDYLVTNSLVLTSADPAIIAVSGLSGAVTAGDYIECKLVYPAFAANPSAILITVIVYITT